MKNLKKILSMMLALLMVISIMAGCGSGKNVETTPDGGYAQGKTAVVSYNASGYGAQWLEKAAEVFEETYKEEGYKIDLKISYGWENDAQLEIGKGPERNDVDLYIDASGLEGILDASKKTMREGGAVLVDLSEEVFNKPAIGADKQEEEKTIGERFMRDKEYLYYYGAREEFHGGIYALPMFNSSCGIILNPSVTEQYGYGLDNLPKTTDELNAMCEKIAETSAETGIYAYSWPGNASGYISYLFFEYFAQYSGKEAFMNFVKTKPSSDATVEDIRENGWQVYEDKGILEGLKAMEPIMKPAFSAPGSASSNHIDAQHAMLTGKAAFMINGDWLLNEMDDTGEQYYELAKDCIMLDTPILSVIGVECGITDAELSKAVGMIDEGKTDAEIIAAISGLDEKETARIREARVIYGCGESTVQAGACIPAYADGRDVAILFLRFLASEDGCQIIRDEAYAIPAFTCESYASRGNTRYMDSVVANINPGNGEYISMDSSLSIVRANAGMLYFNHSSMVQPTTFRSMITDTTGEMTAEKMYENEKAYVKSMWPTWATYIDKD